MKFAEINQLIRGRERDFLVYCGMNTEVVFNKRHQPCSGGGKRDRLRITESGGYHCNAHGSGDYISLLDHYLGMSFSDTLKQAHEFLGLNERTSRDLERIKSDAKKKANKYRILSKIKEDNRKRDYPLVMELNRLLYMIEKREDSEFPPDEELDASVDLALAILKRYENIESKKEWVCKQINMNT